MEIEELWEHAWDLILARDEATLIGLLQSSPQRAELIEYTSHLGETLLYGAVVESLYNTTRALVDWGADRNFVCREKPWSVLYEAVDKNDLNMAALLVFLGPSPYASWGLGSSAYDLAQTRQRIHFVELFNENCPAPEGWPSKRSGVF